MLIWRRSYDTPPPALKATDPAARRSDRRYTAYNAEVPLTECLKGHRRPRAALLERDHRPVDQVRPARPHRRPRQRHPRPGQYLDNIADDAIVGVNIPNGIPLVYELDADLKPIKSYYLGDPEAAAAAAAAVAALRL